MKRRHGAFLAAVGLMGLIAAFAAPAGNQPVVLQRAAKAKLDTPPVAVLIEMGTKDAQARRWDGRAGVTGAKVVERVGYRFRPADKLVEPDAWKAGSHRPLRLPPRNPAAAAREGLATVGVVLHLADVQADAALTVQVEDTEMKPVTVPLAAVLTGKPHPLWDGKAVVRLVSASRVLVDGPTEDDFPAAAYGPDGTLWMAYIAYRVRHDDRRIESAQLKEQPKDFKEYAMPGFADQLFVKYCRDGKWSEPIALTAGDEDLVRCAIAVDGDGTAWVGYSAHRGGKFNVFVRPVGAQFSPDASGRPAPRPGPEQQLTRESTPDLSPVMAATPSGGVLLACQSWQENGKAVVRVFEKVEEGWRDVEVIGAGVDSNHWNPAIEVGPGGKIVAYDAYTEGDYDVRVYKDGAFVSAAASPKFEARPSITLDAAGRLWVAYEEGPEGWGKDFGALDDKEGRPLYFERTVKVVCFHEGRWLRPTAELPELADPTSESPTAGANVERRPRYAYPRLGLDGKGRLWITYRQKFGSRYSSHPGSYWLTFARRLDGDHWSEPIELCHSDGLLDHRPVMLPHPAGGLLLVYNTDGRLTTPNEINNQIVLGTLDLPGDPVEPKLEPVAMTKKALNAKRVREREAVEKIRAYRIPMDGKEHHLVRGEFHRHTEISWDGGPDGSLEDMFRYAIDAAGMDWIGNGDHDNGGGREYSWWLTQKLTDAYHVAGRFTPVFTYERSVAYPHGHRNCMFSQRGVLTLPRLAQPDMSKKVAGIHADDTKMLYRYLHEMKGICAVHTSATSMGTDWRDNDPAVEPVVEIYQGDRMSYEKEEAPRAGYDPKSGKKPANIAGWYPKGYVNLALAQGYKLGFQSSSDHFSTNISYCIVLAENRDRESILAGLRRRHSYGATDDIILDVRSGPHWMGDAFQATDAPSLQVRVIGTDKLARVEVMKDSDIVHVWTPGKAEFTGTWADPKPSAGEHYYYVRVVQEDGEIAWGSPMWITTKQ